MKRFRLFTAFVEPSLLSGTATVLGTLIILVLSNMSFLINSGLFYQTLLGKDSSQDFVQTSHDTISLFTDNVFSNPIVTKVLFFGFWMMIGLFAYISVVSVANLIGETSSNIASEHYMNAQTKRVKEQLLLRLATRAAALLAILMWSWVMLRFVLPFSILSTRVGLNQITQITGIPYILLGGVVLLLSMHLYIILFRLVSLRARVFSSTYN